MLLAKTRKRVDCETRKREMPRRADPAQPKVTLNFATSFTQNVWRTMCAAASHAALLKLSEEQEVDLVHYLEVAVGNNIVADFGRHRSVLASIVSTCLVETPKHVNKFSYGYGRTNFFFSFHRGITSFAVADAALPKAAGFNAVAQIQATVVRLLSRQPPPPSAFPPTAAPSPGKLRRGRWASECSLSILPDDPPQADISGTRSPQEAASDSVESRQNAREKIMSHSACFAEEYLETAMEPAFKEVLKSAKGKPRGRVKVELYPDAPDAYLVTKKNLFEPDILDPTVADASSRSKRLSGKGAISARESLMSELSDMLSDIEAGDLGEQIVNSRKNEVRADGETGLLGANDFNDKAVPKAMLFTSTELMLGTPVKSKRRDEQEEGADSPYMDYSEWKALEKMSTQSAIFTKHTPDMVLEALEPLRSPGRDLEVLTRSQRHRASQPAGENPKPAADTAQPGSSDQEPHGGAVGVGKDGGEREGGKPLGFLAELALMEEELTAKENSTGSTAGKGHKKTAAERRASAYLAEMASLQEEMPELEDPARSAAGGVSHARSSSDVAGEVSAAEKKILAQAEAKPGEFGSAEKPRRSSLETPRVTKIEGVVSLTRSATESSDGNQESEPPPTPNTAAGGNTLEKPAGGAKDSRGEKTAGGGSRRSLTALFRPPSLQERMRLRSSGQRAGSMKEQGRGRLPMLSGWSNFRQKKDMV